MQRRSVDEVFERIASLSAAHPEGFVAFDADGTLWSGDIGEDLFHAMLDDRAFRPDARAAIEREADALRIERGPTAEDTARAIERAYTRGAFPEERYLELHAWALAGATRDAALAYSAEVVERTRLVDRLHGETVAILDRLRGAGVDIFVVSASPRPIVEVAARRVSVDPGHIVAATAVHAGEVMAADVHRPIPYGAGKVEHLRAASGGRTLLAAFGDNHFDAPMLRAAELAVAVRPKPKLREVASEVPGLFELVSV